MSKTAFLFPGQGSQFAGMGKTLAETFPIAKQTFEEADSALGFSISQLCFEGPTEDLKLTENTQPALVAVEVAAYRVLLANGIAAPQFVAGHSLGEYSALVAAGSLSFSDALRLVRKRGQFMQLAVPAGVGAMAALRKLPEGVLDSILSEAAEGEIVSAANFNSPEQVVIAGHAEAVQRAMQLAQSAGGKKPVLLPVSAPFHCALMKPAQEQMKAELEAVRFLDLEIPLVNNWQALEIRTGAEARSGLIEQIPNSVLWTQSMRYLAGQGVSHCVEVGPGSALTGLLRQIDPTLKCVGFGEAADLEKLTATA